MPFDNEPPDWTGYYYSGAPDECNYHYVWAGEIIRYDSEGNCPKEDEHETFGSASNN